jgi:site-specific DNA recombinase
MGRLMLNVLLSFAQFEREMISERTRDKMAAARRKGKYVGGRPVLGYDLDRATKKLVVNVPEAKRVRQIFQLYLNHQALLPVVQELAIRGWSNKRWQTLKVGEVGGSGFTKTSLHSLLTNPIYAGKVTYKGELHDGQQPAIVEEEEWQQVQRLLADNCRQINAARREKTQSLLQGLLRCGNCNCAMTPATSSKKGSKRYRYYVCISAQKRGWHTCPSKSIPAAEIERFVVEQIRDQSNEFSSADGENQAALSQLTCSEGTWDALSVAAQVDILRRLLTQVTYDGARGNISLTLKTDGIGITVPQASTQQETIE